MWKRFPCIFFSTSYDVAGSTYFSAVIVVSILLTFNSKLPSGGLSFFLHPEISCQFFLPKCCKVIFGNVIFSNLVYYTLHYLHSIFSLDKYQKKNKFILKVWLLKFAPLTSDVVVAILIMFSIPSLSKPDSLCTESWYYFQIV